jgi:hypothetical protein
MQRISQSHCELRQTPTDYISAIAIREKAYVASHAHPFPEGSQKRELAELAEPATHLDALDQYLALAPYLVPNKNPELSAFCLWHPDLHSKNNLVSPCTDENGRPSYTITDIIDWQHCRSRTSVPPSAILSVHPGRRARGPCAAIDNA